MPRNRPRKAVDALIILSGRYSTLDLIYLLPSPTDVTVVGYACPSYDSCLTVWIKSSLNLHRLSHWNIMDWASLSGLLHHALDGTRGMNSLLNLTIFLRQINICPSLRSKRLYVSPSAGWASHRISPRYDPSRSTPPVKACTLSPFCSPIFAPA